MANKNQWRMFCRPKVLQVRANLIQIIHQFFLSRQVLLVDTPALSHFGNTDPNIDSFSVTADNASDSCYYLHTSPEYPMKRLLACGSGDIYQISKVFRANEAGRYHNAEFTLLEWYRINFDYFDLMAEMRELMQIINSRFPFYQKIEQHSYQQLFSLYTAVDPLAASETQLRQYLTDNVDISAQILSEMDHNALCDCILSIIIQPKMPDRCLLFVYDYPASQSSLSRLNADGVTARRFEVFVSGIELANGFHELSDALEQKNRFLNDQQIRQSTNQVNHEIDVHLIQALENGLPECSGVALGLERLLMLLLSAKHIKEVICFPSDIA